MSILLPKVPRLWLLVVGLDCPNVKSRGGSVIAPLPENWVDTTDEKQSWKVIEKVKVLSEKRNDFWKRKAKSESEKKN